MENFRKIERTDEWENLLKRTFFKTFFRSLSWENFIEDEFSNIKFERYVWKDELLLSMARAKFLGREKLVSHPFCEYGGALPLRDSMNFADFSKDFASVFGEKARIKFHPYLRGGGPPPLRGGGTPRSRPRPATFDFLDRKFFKKIARRLVR